MNDIDHLLLLHQKEEESAPGAIEVGENSNSTINSESEFSPHSSPVLIVPSKFRIHHQINNGQLLVPTRRASIQEDSGCFITQEGDVVRLKIDGGSCTNIEASSRHKHPPFPTRRLPPNLGPLTKPRRKGSDESKDLHPAKVSPSSSTAQTIRISGIDHNVIAGDCTGHHSFSDERSNGSMYIKHHATNTSHRNILQHEEQDQQKRNQLFSMYIPCHYGDSSVKETSSGLGKVETKVDMILDETYPSSGTDSSSSNHTSSSSSSSVALAMPPTQPVRQESLDQI
jgi:hypothetical protein